MKKLSAGLVSGIIVTVLFTPAIREQYLEDIRSGKCGNIFNAHTVDYNKELQRIAVEETRLGIPLMFGYDVIHGHRTIFPIPLAEDLKSIEKDHEYIVEPGDFRVFVGPDSEWLTEAGFTLKENSYR